ncbi:MAG: iron complex transport system ATP-binding protein [Acidimicrobiales bacterium]|jgi:iron complex transport system ATP-binding protein
MPMESLLTLSGVSVTLDGNDILKRLDWAVAAGQHWVVIGQNGSGKSTLVRLAGLQLHPSTGLVELLGHELGKVDIRPLRARIGLASAGLADQLRPRLTAEEIVKCGRTGALEPWWHTYTDADSTRARVALSRVGLDGYAPRTYGTLSSGEKQRVLVARALVNDPEIVLLDEPTAGLDLGGREELVSALTTLANDPDGPATVMVSHHVEDIPGTTTHILALRGGVALAAGPINEVLSSALLSDVFGLDVELTKLGDRYAARAAQSS